MKAPNGWRGPCEFFSLTSLFKNVLSEDIKNEERFKELMKVTAHKSAEFEMYNDLNKIKPEIKIDQRNQQEDETG